MIRKEFIEKSDFHKYTGRTKENSTNALFFDWKSNDEGNGYKYCVFARATCATKADLVKTLHDFVEGKIDDTDWWIQLVVAPTDKQRFKVPISGGGLNCMIKNY